jgi:hypothetical protein
MPPVREKLFRRPPPQEFVERILHSCGFRAGLADLRWFTKEEIDLAEAETWLPELESYYLPCKATRFLHNEEFTGARMITVLRHILQAHGHTLQTTERMYKDKKQAMYQIQPTTSLRDLSGASLEVSFW